MVQAVGKAHVRSTDGIGSCIKSALRLMVTDSSRLGYRLLQVLSASFAICKALVESQREGAAC